MMRMMRWKALGWGVVALSLLSPPGGYGRAEAARREIVFPPEGAGQIIGAKVLPDQPVTVTLARKKDAAGKPKGTNDQKHREAQIRSIVELFMRYNRGLTNQSARQYAEYVLQAGEQYKQDPFALAALIIHESSANAKAVSKGGDYGLMQVRWSVHKGAIAKKYPHIKKAKDMFDPKYNVLIGTALFARYRGDSNVQGGVLRYSSGNKKLVQKVLGTMKQLETSYQKHLKSLA